MKLSPAILLINIAVNISAQNLQTVSKPVIRHGEIVSVEASKNRIALKTSDGEIALLVGEKTYYGRVSPQDPTDLNAAVPAAMTDISSGDHVVAVGTLAGDKTSLVAHRIYLLTKNDLAKKQATEKEKWAAAKAGRIDAVSAATNEIRISVRAGRGAEKFLTIKTNHKTLFRRYVPGSIKYSEAKTSNFAELQVGDQVSARGEQDADGSRLVAEELISGSFKTVAGTIAAIDAAKRELSVKEILTGKILTIAVDDDTLSRRFPAETAQRLAKQSGKSGAGGEDVDQILEQIPTLQISELKVGDAIAASTIATDTPDRFRAIKFIAGVEPFLKPLLEATSQSSKRSAPSINIPGLDGAP